MKLDVEPLRLLDSKDFRVLTAIEMGQRNHELVATKLIISISKVKSGMVHRCMEKLGRYKLVHHEGQPYDGYRLTYLGYDYLAIKALLNQGHIASIGGQVGVGKESDVFQCADEDGNIMALKLHRLGRTSFRDVKSKRDYLGHRTQFSWLYLSRLAATKEFAFLKALDDRNFPVPAAVAHNRHAVLMEMVDAHPMVQIKEYGNPGDVFLRCMELMGQLTRLGLVHCDFNEFNLLVDEDEELVLIDFPQMVSTQHPNAEELFDRDVECVIRYFKRKVGYNPETDEDLPYVRPNFAALLAERSEDLDQELKASGFAALDAFQQAHGAPEDADEDGSDEDESDEDASDEDEDDENGNDAAEDDAAAGAGADVAANESEPGTSSAACEVARLSLEEDAGPGPSGALDERADAAPSHADVASDVASPGGDAHASEASGSSSDGADDEEMEAARAAARETQEKTMEKVVRERQAAIRKQAIKAAGKNRNKLRGKAKQRHVDVGAILKSKDY